MLSLKQFERYQMSRHLKEWRESEWDSVARFLLTARLWQEAVKNIGEYWFGIPSVPRFQVAWKFPESIARIVGVPPYMLSRVHCDNALCLKSVPRMADEDIYPQSITDAWIQCHVSEHILNNREARKILANYAKTLATV